MTASDAINCKDTWAYFSTPKSPSLEIFVFRIIGKVKEYSDFGLSVKLRNIRILDIGKIKEYSDFGLSVKLRNIRILDNR
jgi:hypothetical protein